MHLMKQNNSVVNESTALLGCLLARIYCELIPQSELLLRLAESKMLTVTDVNYVGRSLRRTCVDELNLGFAARNHMAEDRNMAAALEMLCKTVSNAYVDKREICELLVKIL